MKFEPKRLVMLGTVGTGNTVLADVGDLLSRCKAQKQTTFSKD